MEPGIYLEVKPATSFGFKLEDSMHAYLVYRKNDGTTEVIRGGLEPIRFDINPPRFELKVETGKSLDSNAPKENKSEDAYEGHATPGSRPSRKLSLGGRKPEDVWKVMKKRAKEIGASLFDYLADTDPEEPNQNSNSLTAAVLKAAGIPLGQSVPDGIRIDDLPGVKNDLSNPLDFDIPKIRLDDPNLASRSDRKSKEKRADAGGPAESSPEAREFLDDVVRPGSRADEILLKPVSKWTDDELGVVMGTRLDLPSGHPERNRMADKETEFFKRFHGAGTTPPIPKDPTPARAPDGGDLGSALRRVGADVVRAAGRGGLPPALRDLQRGINLKRDAATALKVDGAFGPLTRTALRRTTADQGSAGVERLLALGRFHGFAEDAERDGPAGLEGTLEAAFTGPERTRTKPVGALKRMLNDLGEMHFGRDAWRPLDDNGGRIGPETTSAFAKVLRAAGPKLLTERFGRFLGIL